MDYSKHGTQKKEKHIRSDIPKAKHKVSFNIFRHFYFRSDRRRRHGHCCRLRRTPGRIGQRPPDQCGRCYS